MKPCQCPATVLNVYDYRTESIFHHKLQFNLGKEHFGCEEERQTRFQNVCVYGSHSIHVEPIYLIFFFFNFANQF